MMFKKVKNWLFALDPESIKGKAFILIFDKIFLGLIIAIAFIAYQNFTTKELRRYDEKREEIQLAFKRAEYIKELIPIVIDDSRDVLNRVYVLAALVDTKAIDSYSVISFASKILSSDYLGKDRYTVYSEDPDSKEAKISTYPSTNRRDFLASIILKAMPSALPLLLDEYANLLQVEKMLIKNDNKSARILNETREFWEYTFSLIIDYDYKNPKDIKALHDILNSIKFTEQHLAELYKITLYYSSPEYDKWGNNNLSLRIIRDIHYISEPVKTFFLGAAERASIIKSSSIDLLEYVVPSNDFAENELSFLAYKILFFIRNETEIDRFDEGLEIFSLSLFNEIKKWNFIFCDSKSLRKFYIDSIYFDYKVFLEWAMQNNKVEKAIEKEIVPIIEEYSRYLNSTTIDNIPPGCNILVDTSLNIYEQIIIKYKRFPGGNIYQLFSNLYNVDSKKLKKVWLLKHKLRWLNLNLEWLKRIEDSP